MKFKLLFIPLLLGILSTFAYAEPSKVVNITFDDTLVKPGQDYTAVIVLDAPAGPGGSNVILLPTHRLEMPEQVKVPQDESQVEFTYEVYKAQTNFRNFSRQTTFTTVFKGKQKEWDGPKVDI